VEDDDAGEPALGDDEEMDADEKSAEGTEADDDNDDDEANADDMGSRADEE
jgi:hypothetical protein